MKAIGLLPCIPFLLLLAGCVTQPQPEASCGERPYWWLDTRRNDEEAWYQKAQGQSRVSEQAAREDALERVRRDLRQTMLAGMEADPALLGGLREVTVVADLPSKCMGVWNVYILAKLDRRVMKPVLDGIRLGHELRRDWREVQTAFHRGDLGVAETGAKSLLARHDQAVEPGFEAGEIHLLLLRLYLRQERNTAARCLRQELLALSTNPQIKAQATSLHIPEPSFREVVNGRTFLVLCSVAGHARADQAELLRARLVEKLQIEGGRMPVSDQETADFRMELSLDIDGGKTGKTRQQFGAEVAELDLKLTYRVYRATDAEPLLKGEIADATQGNFERAFDRVVNLLTSSPRHLPGAATLLSGTCL